MFARLLGLGKAAPTYDSEPSAKVADVQRAPGSLYVTTTSKDGAHHQTCIYMTCDSYVRPTSTRFLFELVVTRSEDDPDQESLHPPDLYFAIDKSAKFDCEGDRFGWSDRTGKRYNLDVDGETFAADLRRAIASSLFQQLHSALPGPDDQKELDDLLTKPPPPTENDLLVSKGELLRVVVEFFVFDPDSESFVPKLQDAVVTISSATVKDDNSRMYLLILYHPQTGERIMEYEISNAMNAQFFATKRSLVWFIRPDEDDEAGREDPNALLTLSIVMKDAEDFVNFRNQFTVCLYEITHKASIDDLKLKDDDVTYIHNSMRDDVEPMDLDESDAEREEDMADSRQVVDDLPHATIDDEDDGVKNSALAIASNNDRTFVVRGNRMGVFQTGDDGARFKTTIGFKDQAGGAFTPSKVLLHQMDRSMLLLDPNDDTKIMRMDLERGEVVDTWKGNLTGQTPVKAVHQAAKYSNRTDTQEFVGLNKNQLLHMDPRTSEFVVQSKKYAASTRAKLDCIATTGMGYVAVASENGDIRMYDQIGKNAKTHLPGLGDPIIGIDVSEDGFFILATTKKYLLVIDTRVKGMVKGGFEKSMGKNKPAPRKLTIKNEDVARYRMGEISFTTAHFNTGDSMERSIVTSSGPFIVVWNFRQVKMGRLDQYKIRRYQDEVVADNFTFNDDAHIVVTLPNDVSVAKR